MSDGHVWIVGAGPGDPGLLTVAGAAALARAEVVLYDALASSALLRGVPEGAELHYVGKRSGHHAMPQDAISSLLVERARQGRRVVRLKGGDPFVFGRGAEEALACRQAGIPFTVIPGVTSAIAVPAYAGIPVTHRGVAANFMVVTSAEANPGRSSVDWQAAAVVDTLVILMGLATLRENMELLVAAGKAVDTPAACIQWGTRADQRVVLGTVETVAGLAAAAGLDSPVVTVVGAVAALANDLDWFAPGSLAGKRIVVTRARTQSSGLAARFEELGASVVEAPAIGVRLLPANITNDERVASRWDWIVFTSQNGVESVFSAIAAGGHDTRVLGTTKVASIGDATAGALAARGVVPDFQPLRATSETLAQELPRASGARILLPLSSLADDRLARGLRERGAHIEQVAAYETFAQPLAEHQVRDVVEADAITFTSASTARNLRSALGGVNVRPETRLISIGRQTSDAVRECFGRIDAEAPEPSLDALVEATREALSWE